MDFTREPIIETVITPRDGCKLVVRSSKGTVQEEYFVDAVEIVSFGHSFFFRSLERPKMFFVPATDYEILEVKETRMALKSAAPDRAIKIGGGKEPQSRSRDKEVALEPQQQPVIEEEDEEQVEQKIAQPIAEKAQDNRADKRNDRRRQSRRRRGREETLTGEESEVKEIKEGDAKVVLESIETKEPMPTPSQQPHFTGLLPPPLTLISDTLARYRENSQFKSAFYSKADEKLTDEKAADEKLTDERIVETTESIAQTMVVETLSIDAPIEPAVELSPDQEGDIYLQRKNQEEESKPNSFSPYSNHDEYHRPPSE